MPLEEYLATGGSEREHFEAVKKALLGGENVPVENRHPRLTIYLEHTGIPLKPWVLLDYEGNTIGWKYGSFPPHYTYEGALSKRRTLIKNVGFPRKEKAA